MKQKHIQKIHLIKNNRNSIYAMHVIFDDFTSKKYGLRGLRENVRKELETFQKQEGMDEHSLKKAGKIVISHMDKKELRNIERLLSEGNAYHRLSVLTKVLGNTVLSASLLSIVVNHFLVCEYPGVQPFIIFSLESLAFPFAGAKLHQFEKKYLPSKYHKNYLRKSILYLTTALIAALDYSNIPPISTWPYYYEIQHTDIEDTGDYSNLTDEEYHQQAVDTIFKNLHNNPYLSDSQLDVLMQLEPYYRENPYLDYNQCFQDMLTVRTFERYNIGDTIMGCCIENNIYYYPNLCEDEQDIVLFHEGVHITGYLDNFILREGMTALLEMEYYEHTSHENSYPREITVVKVFCELIGSDTMLKAYSEEDDNLIRESLMQIYHSEAKVDRIYQTMKAYVDSSNQEELSENCINFMASVLDGIPSELQDDFVASIAGINGEKAYFSQEYKNILNQQNQQPILEKTKKY